MAKDGVDYDKQYEEDLERAQALSLESLALEKFKSEKLLKESGSKNTSGTFYYFFKSIFRLIYLVR